jgi:mRNA interferase HigB
MVVSVFMRVVGTQLLHEFCQQHRDVEDQVEGWLAEAREASWKTTQDVRLRYRSASFLSGNQVIFNLKGNKYRLLTLVNFNNQVILVKKIGTHAEYDKWEL